VSIGIIGGSIGTKFYYPKLADGKASCYIGISEGVLLLVGTKHYIPIGFTYLSKNIFRISFDVGPQIFHNAEEETWIGFSLKLGVSF
jgi:hypothetical protein